MNPTKETNTCRGGEKLTCTKSTNQFVVQAAYERFAEARTIWRCSSKVATIDDQLAAAMEWVRNTMTTDDTYLGGEYRRS